MSADSSPQNRIVGILVLLFVLVFAGVVYVGYSGFSGGGSAVSSGASQDGAGAYSASYIEGMPVLEMQLESGLVTIQLRPDLAPNHVARLLELTNAGFYDGIVFHRVIDGFMAQTGDPTGTGTGGSDLPDMAAEFNEESFQRGTVGMARSASPDSANSQFFIVYGDASFLDRNYTLFGHVVEGMELVDAIRKGPPSTGIVQNPDRIVQMRVRQTQ